MLFRSEYRNAVNDLEAARFGPDDDLLDEIESRLSNLKQRIERLPDAEITREAVMLLDDVFEGVPPGTTIAEKIDMLRADSPADAGIPERIYNRMVTLLLDAQNGTPIPMINQLAPAAAQTNASQQIRQLAESIVSSRAAFRDQTIEDVSIAVTNQLLPSIMRIEPSTQQGRWDLERMLATYQNSPLDVDLGQHLETYIHANPNLETGIRTRVADFMIEQIQARLATPAAPNNNVGNIVQNLINQYPERNQIQALINDLERGTYNELPMAVINADEIVRDDTVSQIIEQLGEYRNTLPAPAAVPAPAQTATDVFNALLVANDNFMLPTPEEGLNTLRALPQLLNREDLRAHFGTTQLSQQQRQELLQYVNELIRQRTEPPQGNAEGGPVQRYAKGGIVKRKIHVAKDLASMKAELMKGR